MFLLINYPLLLPPAGCPISIHLMFLLIWGRIFRFFPKSISIHLMFLLIKMVQHLLHFENTISIHLMFLLIPSRRCAQCSPGHFNTSHVSINLYTHLPTSLELYYFNTSHVSINRQKTPAAKLEKLISIHLMFLLIFVLVPWFSIKQIISIHLMFLLIWNGFHFGNCYWRISIHLMFLLIMKLL